MGLGSDYFDIHKRIDNITGLPVKFKVLDANDLVPFLILSYHVNIINMRESNQVYKEL